MSACICAFLRLILSAVEVYAESLLIVAGNECKSQILIPDNSADQVRKSASELARYICLSTGAAPSIENISAASPDSDNVKIILNTAKPITPPGTTKPDGSFSITFPGKKTILISGSTDLGTEFGTYEFLERYVGIRWLIPGEYGEYVPKHESLSVPAGDVRGKPAFVSRLMSGLRGPEQALWARRNRMHGQIKFHHNLSNLFPPAKYAKARPEFYPLKKGKRFIPPDDVKDGWQPCFSAPGIIEEAVKNICEYFEKNPRETSYSLGANDSSGYCECDACLARSSGEKNFLGRRDFSETYFEWANAVVEGVLKQYPDKWFGCLAYSEVAQAPSRVRLHSRIVPYLTYDRMKWLDKGFESEGKAITNRWSEKTDSLGWYDYIYGTPYLVPRIYFHQIANYYLYGFEHGVRAIYSEAYPNWGEGPKLYISLKLQWNPYLDVDALLKEWCEKAVGKDAGPYLENYYRLWENFWEKKAPKSNWFADKEQYLPFDAPGYLDMVTDEMTKSRLLLENVLNKAITIDQKKRSHYILKAFEYYETSAASYKAKKKCFDIGLFEMGNCDAKREMEKKRLDLINEFEKDPVLIHPLRFDKYKNLQW